MSACGCILPYRREISRPTELNNIAWTSPPDEVFQKLHRNQRAEQKAQKHEQSFVRRAERKFAGQDRMEPDCEQHEQQKIDQALSVYVPYSLQE